MKKRITATAIAILFLAGVSSSTAAGQEKKFPDLSGQWTMTVQGSGHGPTTMGLALTQTGKEINGTFSSPHGEVAVKGEFVDNTLTLETAGDGHLPEVTFNATLKDDGTLSGYLSSSRGDMTWTAERAKK